MQKHNKVSYKTAQNYVKILGIKVDITSTSRLLTGVRAKISHSSKFYIVTPNPELVLASERNLELKSALNNATFAVPDGVGLSYASRFLYGTKLDIIPGRVLFKELIQLANKMGWRVFFLGGEGDEAEKAAEKLRLNYKSVKIETFAGPKLDGEAMPVSEVDKSLLKDAVDRINKFNPHLLFVAFGNPKQEIWIYKNLKSLNVIGAMAVGGTFRYIAGISKLPPQWMEKAGLEWVWRLITEPKRIGRIYNAFPVFPLRVFWFKVTGR